jgi:hypothetical protein
MNAAPHSVDKLGFGRADLVGTLSSNQNIGPIGSNVQIHVLPSDPVPVVQRAQGHATDISR